MQETRNNCFASKKRSTTLFSTEEGSGYVFRPETNVANFLHLMVLLFRASQQFNKCELTNLKAMLKNFWALFFLNDETYFRFLKILFKKLQEVSMQIYNKVQKTSKCKKGDS